MRDIVIRFIGWYYLFLVNRRTRKKHKKIFANIKSKNLIQKVNNENLIRHITKWSKLDKRISTLSYQIFSSLANNADENFIPENVFYTKVEPVLNNKIFAMAYRDKNSYDFILNSDTFPKVYLRNIDGLYFDNVYRQIDNVEKNFQSLLAKGILIVKPSFNTGGGMNIKLLKANADHFVDQNNIITDFKSLQKEYTRNFLIQEHIQQHKFTAQFNESSLNTFRLLTYRSVENNKVHLIQSVLRIGQKGTITDNQAGGGIAVGIDPQKKTISFGVDKWGNKFDSFNNIDFKNVGVIPKFDQMEKLVVELSSKLIYSRLIGWDVCIDENENIRIIELNNIYNEINFFQMTNGPLFSKFTDEVIAHCKISPGTYSANYYLKN